MGTMRQNIEGESRGEKRTAFGFVNNRILSRLCCLTRIHVLYDKGAFIVNVEKYLPTLIFFHGQGDLGKIIDPEGQVVEPLECSHYWRLWGTFVGIQSQGLARAWDFFPRSLRGCCSKASPTRPSGS